MINKTMKHEVTGTWRMTGREITNPGVFDRRYRHRLTATGSWVRSPGWGGQRSFLQHLSGMNWDPNTWVNTGVVWFAYEWKCDSAVLRLSVSKPMCNVCDVIPSHSYSNISTTVQPWQEPHNHGNTKYSHTSWMIICQRTKRQWNKLCLLSEFFG